MFLWIHATPTEKLREERQGQPVEHRTTRCHDCYTRECGLQVCEMLSSRCEIVNTRVLQYFSHMRSSNFYTESRKHGGGGAGHADTEFSPLLRELARRKVNGHRENSWDLLHGFLKWVPRMRNTQKLAVMPLFRLFRALDPKDPKTRSTLTKAFVYFLL